MQQVQKDSKAFLEPVEKGFHPLNHYGSAQTQRSHQMARLPRAGQWAQEQKDSIVPVYH
jgi:hypothetical protein